jgi:hypothetical protein
VPYEAERRYLDASNVLETTFTTAHGSVRLTDAMTLSDDRAISPMRELVRKAEGLAGAVPLRWSVEPRFRYGERRTRIEHRFHRGTPWSDAEETPLLEPPGFMLMNYGRRTALWTLLAHVAYGAIVGGF